MRNPSLLLTDHSQHDVLRSVEEVEDPNLYAACSGPQLVNASSEMPRNRAAQLVTEHRKPPEQVHHPLETSLVLESLGAHPLEHRDATRGILEEDDPDRRHACLPFYRNLAESST